MKENNFLFILLLLFFTCFKLNAEIIVLSKCNHKEDGFLKNEYILNLNELTMTRNYVYNEKTYKKYKITDLSVKKSNSFVRNIYEEEGKILNNHITIFEWHWPGQHTNSQTNKVVYTLQKRLINSVPTVPGCQ